MGFFDFLKDVRTPLRIRQCSEDLQSMIAISEEIFDAATQYALENEALTLDLKAKDTLINQLEVVIRRTMHDHLQIDPWHDLAYCLTLLSIVQDAERVGDLGKSIAKVADMAHKNRVGESVQNVRELRALVASQFPLLREAFAQNDEQKARQVMENNDLIKQKTTDILQRLANNETISANEGVVLALLARMIGRVSSHLSNVASSMAMPFEQIRRAPTWA